MRQKMNNILYESGLEVDCQQIIEPLYCCKCKKVLDCVEVSPNCEEEIDVTERDSITGNLMTVWKCDKCDWAESLEQDRLMAEIESLT